MPFRDRRYENVMRFIIGALPWLIILYAIMVAVERVMHCLTAHCFQHTP